MKPIYLFADSQLLFWKDEGRLFLDSVRDQIEQATPKAAYIGASNGDDPAFYSIFQAAMEGIGIRDCCMVTSALTEAEASFVNEADLILLSGGDLERGWEVFRQNGLCEIIVKRFWEGALLIGVSAGAVQLGWFGWSEGTLSQERLIDTFKLVPFIIDAHDEKNDWGSLRQALRLAGGVVNGIGLPKGGGIVYHSNQSVEPLRHPIIEFSLRDGEIVQSLLLPPSLQSPEEIVEDEWAN